jgi:hypothetical protein
MRVNNTPPCSHPLTHPDWQAASWAGWRCEEGRKAESETAAPAAADGGCRLSRVYAGLVPVREGYTVLRLAGVRHAISARV